MKPVEFWKWYLPPARPGLKPRATRYKMSERTMRESFPEGLERVPGSCELRLQAETEEERIAHHFAGHAPRRP